MSRDTCRDCGQYIIWMQTCNGDWLPCDPETTTVRDLESGDRLINDEGIIFYSSDTDDHFEEGYVIHFSTCPKSSLRKPTKEDPKDLLK